MSYLASFILKFLNKIEICATRHQLRQLHFAGKEVVLGRGVKIERPECVSLGDFVHLNDQCWLSVVTENIETGRPSIRLNPILNIGSRTYIGRFGMLSCMDRITIGKNVIIADRVFIGDAIHGFKRADLPIRDQYLISKGPVEIGDGTWVGIGVSIMSNVKIGRNCVIGAGSVVTQDVPDFCTAVGNPARILGRMNV